MEPIPATACKGTTEVRKPQPGRTAQLWTVTHDPRGLFRAGKAQFGSLDITAMLREHVFAEGTELLAPDGQAWRIVHGAKVKI